MSNLASMVLEGAGMTRLSSSLTSHYDHENGAGLIAMESAEALHEIFEAEFYVPNTCTIQAAMEGVSVEESTQASVMEASIKGAFEKIKQFFINLKDKVKEFLHNIKRYLTGIFGNDEKWVKEYEKEVKAIDAKSLKDYKIKMYTYTVDDALTKDELSKKLEDGVNTVEGKIADIKDISKGVNEQEVDADTIREDYDKEYLAFIKDLCGKSIDADELDKALWSKMRNGADNDGDMDDVEVASNRDKFIAALKESKKVLAAYDTMISKTDSNYNKAIKVINDAEKKFNNLKSDDNGVKEENGAKFGTGAQANVTTMLHAMSSFYSKMQNADNKKNNAAKAAVVERNAAYKKALVGCFAYARKNKGGK